LSNIFVEQQADGTYVAIQSKTVIAVGSTQAQTADRAHAKSPGDPVLAERVRMTKGWLAGQVEKSLLIQFPTELPLALKC
jgi:hypothetical protein